jgi:hypothetical protein
MTFTTLGPHLSFWHYVSNCYVNSNISVYVIVAKTQNYYFLTKNAMQCTGLCRCQSQNQGQGQSVQQKQQTDLYLLGNTNTSIPCGLFNSSMENCDGSMSIQWWDYRSSDAGALIVKLSNRTRSRMSPSNGLQWPGGNSRRQFEDGAGFLATECDLRWTVCLRHIDQ